MNIYIRDGKEGDQSGIAETIAEAFYDSFKAIVKSKQKIVEVLTVGIQPQLFIVAEEGECIVGVIGMAAGGNYPILYDKKAAAKHFGWLRAKLAAPVVEAEFYQPKTFQEGQCQLAFVAVREGARGRGTAKQMLLFLLEKREYSLYTLDVVEGNERALSLYKGVGFQETGRQKEENRWIKGFSYRYLLSYRPEKEDRIESSL